MLLVRTPTKIRTPHIFGNSSPAARRVASMPPLELELQVVIGDLHGQLFNLIAYLETIKDELPAPRMGSHPKGPLDVGLVVGECYDLPPPEWSL